MRIKRVLMLTTRFWPTIGGAQKHVLELSQNLTRLGIKVFVVAEKDPLNLHSYERIKNVEAYRGPIRRGLFLLFPTYILLALAVQHKVKAEMIHAHFALPCGLVGLLISKLYRKPLIITVHGIDIIKEASIKYGIRLNPLLDWLTKWVLRQADHIIVCSRFIRKLVLECGVKAAQVSLIPNGIIIPKVDPKKFKREILKEKLGLPKNSFLLFTARRLVPKNGIEYLIKASKILMNLGIKFHVVVVGDGPLKKHLKKLSKQLGVAEKISFLGEVSNKMLELLYLASDAVVLPSIIEAFGFPVLEAMAYRRPIIAFNSGGPADIIQQEGTGIIVENKEASALAQAIMKLIKEPELIKEIEQRCSIAIHKYEWSEIARRTIQLYDQLLQS